MVNTERVCSHSLADTIRRITSILSVTIRPTLTERQLKPEPRLDVVKLLHERGVLPTSMIDISDGLASESMHLATDSALGCCLYEEKLPIDTQTYQTLTDMGLLPTTVALNGGEDYELLF